MCMVGFVYMAGFARIEEGAWLCEMLVAVLAICVCECVCVCQCVCVCVCVCVFDCICV